MKYYVFRDLDNYTNLENDRDYHAAGYVSEIVSKDFIPSASGKDMSVIYLHPFDVMITCAWRAFSDVELFEIEKKEYESIVREYELIKTR